MKPNYTKRIGSKNIYIWISPTTDMDRTKIYKYNLTIVVFKLSIVFSWDNK